MKIHQWTIVLLLYLIIGSLFTVSAQETVAFGGGPNGGTFITFANGVQSCEPVMNAEDFEVQVQSSWGSVENLHKTDSDVFQMSVVYSGHVYLGRNGLMTNDPQLYTNVMALAWLYGAPAQLVVRQDSGITDVSELVGKKVGVGNVGSGAYANCEKFFSHLNLWDSIDQYAMGYNDSAQALINNELDAFWLFTAFPSSAVITAAASVDIALLDVDTPAEASGYYLQFPYFDKITIPMNTYEGVDYDTSSFMDSALWVANATLSANIVYDMLSMIYSEEGLAHIKAQKLTFKDMSVATGTKGVVTPFHPGAKRFWKEQGYGFCLGNLNEDHVVDGRDIVSFITNDIDVETFADEFGNINCI